MKDSEGSTERQDDVREVQIIRRHGRVMVCAPTHDTSEAGLAGGPNFRRDIHARSVSRSGADYIYGSVFLFFFFFFFFFPLTASPSTGLLRTHKLAFRLLHGP